MPKWLERLGGDSEIVRRFMATDDVVMASSETQTETSEAEEDKPDEKETDDSKASETPKHDAGDGNIDWDEWLADQPKSVQEALAKREHGLKSALEKSTKAARDHEKELKRLAQERQLAEEKKLRDQGEHEKLAEKYRKEAEELKARLEAEEWTKQTRQRLKDAELTEFEDILLAGRETPDDVAETGERLKALVDARVEKEVNRRLETGTRVKSNGSAIPTKKVADMSETEKEEFIQEHGLEKWTQLVTNEFS